VLGLACREEGALDASIEHLRQAVSVAYRARSPKVAAEARIGLMASYAIAGNWRAALRQGDLAATQLQGPDRARVHAQMGTVLREQGRFDEALVLYRRAFEGLRNGGDSRALALLHHNRGGTHLERGAFAAALREFERAEKLHREAGHFRQAAQSRQSIGVVRAQLGDVPGALRAFAEADAYLGGEPDPDAMVLRDRAWVLLAARLVEEARRYLDQSVAQLERSGLASWLAQAQVFLAEAALLGNEPEVARVVAEKAAKAFARQQRPAWRAIARNLIVRAAWSDGERSPELLRAARRTADELARAGFVIQAADARLLAARIALDLGKVGIARRELEITTRARARGPVDLRVRAWHAEALLRLQDGNRRGARRALNAGIAVLNRYRTTLGATDLRVHAAGHGEELAALGIRLAVEDGDAGRVLAWSERCRAVSLRPRALRPPQDAQLAADLAELRQLVTSANEAALAGRPGAGLNARQAALEERVRDRARHATGLHAASLGGGPGFGELAAALGDKALFEVVEYAGALHAVVVVGRKTLLTRLATREEVLDELDQVRFSLRRVAFGGGSQASTDAALDALEFGLDRLDHLLMSPVRGQIGDRELVVVPTGALHALPWGALPSLGWRPVAVVPSAAVWHAATVSTTAGSLRDVVLVAGPDLPNAEREIAALACWYPGARQLTGEDATAEAVRSALDGADLAHVAAHGHFRTDNPLFSSLRMADGPITVYDLESLARPPGTLVLSACDSGVSDVGAGDELMGLVASLLAIGTRTIVGATCPVPDDASCRLMVALHAGMVDGLSPGAALARAQRQAAGSTPADVATAVGFACFGAGP
jgi:tetratricopeptide (TPR) repeat protein